MVTESSGGLDPVNSISQFDPLDLQTDEERQTLVKKQVINLLRSYNGWWDIFAELIQNAMDAVYQQYELTGGHNYDPHINIQIDMRIADSNSIRVSDNGLGMDTDDLQNLFKPNYTTKYDTSSGIGLRGHKGVGATYLAYGFNHIKVQSKKSGFHQAVEMINGREWCENHVSLKPTVNNIDLFDNELEQETSGTSIEIRLSGTGQYPKNLSWMNLRKPEDWLNALQVRTALGQVKLSNNTNIPADFRPRVTVSYWDTSIPEALVTTKDITEYAYPHEFPIYGLDTHGVSHNDDCVKSITDIENKRVTGQTNDEFRNFNPDLFNLECIYHTWNAEELIDQGIISPDLPKVRDTMEDPENVLSTIRNNNFTVYCAFLDSVPRYDTLNASFHGREGYYFLKPGIQLATSTMPQGEVYDIDLRRYEGYSKHIHILIHADNVEPDLGRKNFQKEHVDLCMIIGTRITERMLGYRRHLRDRRGSNQPYDGTNRADALARWLERAEETPLPYPNIPSIAIPREEQDVIALYHQLLGSQDIQGVKVLASSINGQYDAGLTHTVSTDYMRNEPDKILGVGRDAIQQFENSPVRHSVAEFKHLLEYIWEDFRLENKHPRDLDVVICWDLGNTSSSVYDEDFSLETLLPPEGNGLARRRQHYGSTHRVAIGADNFEVICLKSFLEQTQSEA